MIVDKIEVALVTFFLGLVVICVPFLIFCDKADNDLATERIESGWECYLDGEKIDGTTVDISEYKITFNEEKKFVILTKREYNNSKRYIPLLIPYR